MILLERIPLANTFCKRKKLYESMTLLIKLGCGSRISLSVILEK